MNNCRQKGPKGYPFGGVGEPNTARNAGWPRIFCAALAVVLLLQGMGLVLAGAAGEPLGFSGRAVGDSAQAGIDTIYNEEELLAWVEAHKATGGEVRLGADVTLHQSWYDNERIIIDTGAFSLICEDVAPSNTQVTGQGVDRPVVEFHAADWYWLGNWNNMVAQLHVTATGRDGVGGTALRVMSTGGGDFLFRDAETPLISSHGEGAVGVELPEAGEVYCLNITVSGKNSTAVKAPGETAFYYCNLSAQGENARAGSQGLFFDTCNLSPRYDGEAVNREILDDAANRLYLPVRQGKRLTAFDLAPFSSPVYLLGGGAYPQVWRAVPMEWDNSFYDIDTSRLGSYPVTGEPILPLRGLGLLNGFAPELTVEVRDPEIPCIGLVKTWSDESGDCILLEFWDAYDPQVDPVTLWRSDDMGETWWDATLEPEFAWDGSSLFYYDDDLGSPILFQLELEGVGESNIVQVGAQLLLYSGELGGDRTGTDRVVVPKPGTGGTTEPETPDPDGNGGQDGSNGQDGNGNSGEAASPSAGGETTPGKKSPGGTWVVDTYPAAADETALTEEALPVDSPAEPTPLPEPAVDGNQRQSGILTLELSPAKALPEEWEDDTSIAISGLRLLALLDEPVVFILGDLRIVVDEEALAALHVAEHQQFTVTVEANGAGYTVQFALDGQLVELPYTLLLPEPDVLAVSTQPPAPATAVTPPAAQEEPGGNRQIVLWGGGILAASGCGWVLLRKFGR